MRCPDMDRFNDAHSLSLGQEVVPGVALHFGVCVTAEAKPSIWKEYMNIERFFEDNIIAKISAMTYWKKSIAKF